MKDPFEQYKDFDENEIPTNFYYQKPKEEIKEEKHLEGLANRNNSEESINALALELYENLMLDIKQRIKSEETKWYARDKHEGKEMRRLKVDFLYWVINNYESEKLLEMALKELASRLIEKIQHLERSEFAEWKSL